MRLFSFFFRIIPFLRRMKGLDPRYKTVRSLILSGEVKTLDEIFIKDMIVKSVVAKDLGLRLDRWNDKMEDVRNFNLDELIRLAELIDIELIKILSLIANQYALQKKRGKK